MTDPFEAVALRLEREAAACLDVAVAFPGDPVGEKCRGKAVAFACAADWVRDADCALLDSMSELADELTAAAIRFQDLGKGKSDYLYGRALSYEFAAARIRRVMAS